MSPVARYRPPSPRDVVSGPLGQSTHDCGQVVAGSRTAGTGGGAVLVYIEASVAAAVGSVAVGGCSRVDVAFVSQKGR